MTELHNSRMKLTVSLAPQSVLRPLCLRRLPAAYASVSSTGIGSCGPEARTKSCTDHTSARLGFTTLAAITT